MRNLKKLFVLCSLALVFTLVLADGAFAEGDSIMAQAADKALNLFQHVKGIIFVVGGFGLVGIAFQAIFGKVKWAWFAGLAIGLALLAAANSIINYATGDRPGTAAGGEENIMHDTFGESPDGM
ncbi:MAG: TrbC/VirB2 family protein [Alphaproteobacteria bacterium]|nr:TrbC/VirB2 family protein [Alphaproteobacteria bacterium]